MKGQVLDFSIQSNIGIISAEDQKRYEFSGAEWRGDRPPTPGEPVDFAINDAGQAVQIYLMLNSQPHPSYSPQYDDQTGGPSVAEENFTMIDWVKKCLHNYANFNGRARRKEFWFFYLACILVSIVAQIVDKILGTGELVNGLLNLALIVPSLAVGARRLHDVGRSGWWQLLIITIIGIIPLIVWWVSDTKFVSNKWGRPAR